MINIKNMRKIIARIRGAFKYLFTGHTELKDFNISGFVQEQENTFELLEILLNTINIAQKEFVENSKYDIAKIDKSFDLNCMVFEDKTLKQYLQDFNNDVEIDTKKLGISSSDINEINEILLTDSNVLLLNPTQRIIVKKLQNFIELGSYAFSVMKVKQELYLTLSEIRREEL